MQADSRDGSSVPVLLVKLKKQSLARYPLERFRTVVGRSPQCDIVLEGSSFVSRNHAQVLIIDGEVVVEDLGSRNGICVNEIPCKRHTLKPGDRIGVGQYRLHLLNCQPHQTEQPESVTEIAGLFRLWRNAAVTSTEVDSVLLGLPGETGTWASAEHDEPAHLDEDQPVLENFDDDPCDGGIQPIDAEQMGLSTFVRPLAEQGQLMEKAVRLVDQDASSDSGAQDSGQADAGIRSLRSSVRGRLRRGLDRRRKPMRRC